VRAFAERLGLRALINRLVPTEREFEPGLMVLAMLVDTLSGRSPLYHLESFFEGQDTELLLGEAVEASVFNVDNAGATLDLLFRAGTQKIYSEVAVAAMRAFEVATDEVHFDTTSVSVYGDYDSSQAEGSPLKITHGYSKDKRPDLKQFVFSLLCTGGNIPIIGVALLCGRSGAMAGRSWRARYWLRLFQRILRAVTGIYIRGVHHPQGYSGKWSYSHATNDQSLCPTKKSPFSVLCALY
jgi:hypothetical protein